MTIEGLYIAKVRNQVTESLVSIVSRSPPKWFSYKLDGANLSTW